MAEYLPRVLDRELQLLLEAFGAVLIVGPKWCGKTTTAGRQAKSAHYMQAMEQGEAGISIASIKPSLLLEGENPRLIDEWQVEPTIWDAVRHSVDMRGETGLYILTGSTSVDESKIKHSGAGRIARLKMYTMSLFESKDSNGKISLAGLFQGQQEVHAVCDLDIEDYAGLIVRGGWPQTIGKSEAVARRQIAGYCDTIVRSDISTVDGIERDEHKMRALLRSYARHVGTPVTHTVMQADIEAHNGSLHTNTIPGYLAALRRLYVIDEVPAWSPQLRSKTTIRTSAVRHFIDPALAAHFLHTGARDLLYDLKTYGFLFESLALRDLKIYTQALGGDVFHYRDRNGLEADAIIHLHDGRWAAIEVKLGSQQVDQAAANLLKLKETVNSETMREPEFLLIITGSQYAYRRPDGVYVAPLGVLGP